MRTIVKAVIQARMGSSRLKGKSLKIFSGKPLLHIIIDRLRECPAIDKIIVATSTNADDDKIFEFCNSINIDVIRGSETDVLSRYVLADEKYPSEYTIRVTGDNPFISFEYLNQLILFAKSLNLDYSSIKGLPIGMAAEIYKSELSAEIYSEELKDFHKEHVTPYFYENPGKFNIKYFEISCPYNFRLTVDCAEDAEVISQIIEDLNETAEPACFHRIIEYCQLNKELLSLNADIIQRKYNEKY